jgi:hypothetical protein
MKYVITESKLFDTIYQYIDSYLNPNKMDWVYGSNEGEDNEEYPDDENLIHFYKGEWDGEDNSDIVFNYLDVDYFEDKPGSYRNDAPIVEVMGQYADRLDTLFNEHWKSPMKQWIKDNFNLPVKSVSTYY